VNDEKESIHPGRRSREEFERQLAAKQARKLRAMRQRDRNAWFGLGMFGVVGWSVAIPAVALTALGVWIDARSSAPYSWTLMLLVIGMAVGCLNAWFWISRERRDIEEQRQLPPEEEPRDED
jgi:ATP synthase protein I